MRKEVLEELYSKYNRRECAHPDPVVFLYPYDDPLDREIVALVAASLAYGRVAQIHRSVSSVLGRMPSPSAFLKRATGKSLESTFAGFKHRFTTGEELARMLVGIKRLVSRHGSLRRSFAARLKKNHDTVIPALALFVEELKGCAGDTPSSLIPSPEAGSACKRFHLFLRWMVRTDEVDPGGWEEVPASKLVVPLDTHMHRICRYLKLTHRRQADARTACEITEAFRRVVPEDPVRYDFALTRLGMRGDRHVGAFVGRCLKSLGSLKEPYTAPPM
jgi:uncharacterized protein (TIGR02757 family)